MTSLIQQGPLALFAGFLVLHFLADFPLQGEYLARNKVRTRAGSKAEWVISMCAHCAIQGGGVWLVGGSLALGTVEFVLHGLIDLGKGESWFGLVSDQLLHVACKAGYVVMLCSGFS